MFRKDKKKNANTQNLAKALSGYTAKSQYQLTFKKGETVTLIRPYSPALRGHASLAKDEWWYAEKDNKIGLVLLKLFKAPENPIISTIPHSQNDTILYGQLRQLINSGAATSEIRELFGLEKDIERIKKAYNDRLPKAEKSGDNQKAPFQFPSIKNSPRATALWDYHALDENELSFQRADTLLIIKTDDSGWWLAEKDGVKGLIPSNFIKLQNSSEASAVSETKSPDPFSFPADMHCYYGKDGWHMPSFATDERVDKDKFTDIIRSQEKLKSPKDLEGSDIKSIVASLSKLTKINSERAKKLKDFEKKLSQPGFSKNECDKIRKNLEATQKLLKQSKHKEARLTKVKYLSEHPVLHEYFHSFQLKLSSIYIAALSIHSRMIANDSSGATSALGDIVCGLSSLAAPGVPFIGFAGKVIEKLLDGYTVRKQRAALNYMLQLAPTTTEMDQITEFVAMQCTFACRDKIMLEQEAQKISVTQAAKRQARNMKAHLLKEADDTPVKQLAATHVEKIIKVIFKGKLECVDHNKIRSLLIQTIVKDPEKIQLPEDLQKQMKGSQNKTEKKSRQKTPSLNQKDSTSVINSALTKISRSRGSSSSKKKRDSAEALTQGKPAKEVSDELSKMREELARQAQRQAEQEKQNHLLREKIQKLEKARQDNDISNEVGLGTQAMLNASNQKNPRRKNKQGRYTQQISELDRRYALLSGTVAVISEQAGMKIQSQAKPFFDDEENRDELFDESTCVM